MSESGLAYSVGGAPDGVPLVLLHAFPLNRTMWHPVLQHLGDRFRVVLIDLPGLGESPVPVGEPSLRLSADGVAGVLDELKVDSAVFAGVSMGGYVLMEFLRRHPGRVGGVALIDTKASSDDAAAAANRERIAQAVLGPQGVQVLEAMVPALLGESSIRERPDVVAWVRASLAEAAPAGVAWSQRAMARRDDSIDVLKGLAGQEVSVVVVVGEEDTLSPPAEARAMASAACADLVTVPAAGHLAAVEAPDVVAKTLVGLMADVAAR